MLIILCACDWSTGTTVCAEIQGVIEACVKLTGMPDLTLSFMVSSPSPLILDISLLSNDFPSNLLT